MSDEIEKLRKAKELLAEIESDLESAEDTVSPKNFDAFEVPQLVVSIVDHLQPELLPYEAAIYWYLFRHSVLGTGQQYVRTSVRRLASDVVMTSRSRQAEKLSYRTVQEALRGLEDKKVVLKAGEPDREGTPYKVCLPEEIPACRERMKQALADEPRPVDEKKELDYYNVPENRLKVFERDGYRCWNCEKQLTRFTATLDHLQPVSEGGDNSFDNLRTACLHCNSRRGNRPLMDAMARKPPES